MTEPLGEVNLDDILQVGGDFAWNYQGVEQDVFPAPVEAYPFEIPPQGYYNEVPMNHPHHYGPAMHHQQLTGYVPELAQHHQMIDPHQEVIHHASQHIGYLEPAGPIEDIFDKVGLQGKRKRGFDEKTWGSKLVIRLNYYVAH